MSEHNPKYIEAQKRGKLDYSAVPWSAVVGMARAMTEGADKYGRFNFRKDAIEARTYIAAIMRHLIGDPSTGSLGWVNGEDIDAESGLHHLHKVMSCCLLVLDAQAQGKLIDNRLETESKTPPSAREDALTPAGEAMLGAAKALWGGETVFDNITVEDAAAIQTDALEMRDDVNLYESSLGWINYHNRAPGWYAEFRDESVGMDELWVHVVGPFPDENRATFYAQTNPHNYAGLRSLIEIKNPI